MVSNGPDKSSVATYFGMCNKIETGTPLRMKNILN